MKHSLGLSLWLLPRRIRSAWGLLAVTAFGVLAAVTIMALGAMYSQALAEAGLRHALAITTPTAINTQVVVRNRPLGPEDYQALRTDIESIMDRDVGYLVRSRHRYGKVLPTIPIINPASATALGALDEAPLGRPVFVTGFTENSVIVDGRWPQDAVTADENGRPHIEAVIGPNTSRQLGWGVGQRAWMVVYPAEPPDPPQYIAVTVVGIAEPINPRAEYWMGATDYFRIGDWDGRPTVPLYVTEAAYFNGVGKPYPTLVGDYGWFLYINADVITADTVQQTRDDLTALETDINSQFPRSYVLTILENGRGTGLLAKYQKELTLARAPLYLFISLVVVVILYFLALAVGLLAGARSSEASMLRSRGASMGQVGGLLGSGEGLVVVAATAVGPLLAWGIGSALLLGTINPADRPGVGDTPIAVGLSWQMYAMGVVGGLLSLGVLAVAGGSLARLGILDFLRARARPPSAPWLQRYYIDVLAVVALVVLVWQIRQRGGFVEGTLTGRGPALDPLLLLAPAAALLTLAFLMLRVLPWAMAVAAWTSRHTAPAWVALALRQMARRPLPYAALTVVVTLAAALGVFAGSFQTTLARSEAEQASHRIGGDITLNAARFLGEREAQKVAALNDIEGVEAVSQVIRQSVSFVDGPTQRGALLGVDPITMPRAAWWRDDFAADAPATLDTLLAPLRRTLSVNTAGIALPEEAESVGMWVRRDDSLELGAAVPLPTYRLWLRIGDERGFYRNVELGTLQPEFEAAVAWRHYRIPLPETSVGSQDGGNRRVVALYISGDSFSRTPPGGLSFDDLTAYGRGLPAGGEILEGFEDLGPWVVLPQGGSTPDHIERTANSAHSGDAGLAIRWQEPLGRSPRGIIIPPGPVPVPAIGGPGYTSGQLVRVTVDGYIVPTRIASVVDYFPTLDHRRSFLVVSAPELRAWLQQAPGAQPVIPDEWWFDIAEDADRETVAAAIRDEGYSLSFIRDRAAAVDVATRNPLAGGAWNALTGIGLAALALAVGLALCAHGVVAVREQRVDMSVGAALGVARWQRFAGLALERVIIAVLGIVVGGLAGWGLAQWTLGQLTTNAAGGPVTPPLVFVAEGPWLIATFVCLAVAAVAAITLAGLTAGRLRPPEILRETE